MKVLNVLPVLILTLCFQQGYASSINEDDTQDQKNQTDAQGRKQGHWVYYGKDKPDKPEYKPDEKVEEGPYKDNRKHGMWKSYYPGEKLKSEIEFKYNRPNGKYIKYHETTGEVKEQSQWTGRGYQGDFQKYNEDGILVQEKTFKNGKTDGKVAYYYDDGTPEFVFNTKNGVETGTATRYWPNGDVKEVIQYSDGKVTKREEKERVNPPKEVVAETTKTAPDDSGEERGGSVDEKTNEAEDGYKKKFNENGDLWKDGYFKNGKLWDGKLYKYDQNGLLYKIEIYKEGKYFGDGVLEF